MSEEAKQKISKSRTGNGDNIRTCEFCSVLFEVNKPSSRARFCSSDCSYASREGENHPRYRTDMPVFECWLCGTVKRKAAMSNIGRFCSNSCKSVYYIRIQPTELTDIEQKVGEELDHRGWFNIPQVELLKTTVVDFLLPYEHTVIYCDGDYWHSSQETLDRDARKTKALENVGFFVYRFWGSEIKADVGRCVDQVKP